MSEIHDDIQALEREISTAEEMVELRQMALRLSENRDFRKLFIEGYFLNDAARLVQLSTDPRLDDKIRNSALEEARATGFMRRYLSDIVQAGAASERNLPEQRATLEELRAAAAAE